MIYFGPRDLSASNFIKVAKLSHNILKPYFLANYNILRPIILNSVLQKMNCRKTKFAKYILYLN